MSSSLLTTITSALSTHHRVAAAVVGGVALATLIGTQIAPLFNEQNNVIIKGTQIHTNIHTYTHTQHTHSNVMMIPIAYCFFY